LEKFFTFPGKTAFAVKVSTVLNIDYLSFRIFEQLAIALKNRAALKIFTVLSMLLHSVFLNNLRLP